MGIGLRLRRFDGKNYYFARFVSTKREANERAKAFRKQGDRHARITEEGNGYARSCQLALKPLSGDTGYDSQNNVR